MSGRPHLTLSWQLVKSTVKSAHGGRLSSSGVLTRTCNGVPRKELSKTAPQVSLPLFEWRVHFLPHRAACCRRRIAGCQQGGSDLSAFFPTPGLRQCWIARPGGQRALVLFDSGVGADKKRKGLHLLSAGRLKLHTSSSIVAGPPRLCPRRDRFWVGGLF